MKDSTHLRQLDNDVLIKAIASTTSPLIITDNQQPDNPIIYANDAFLQLTGYDESEIIGHNCRFLQGEDTDRTVVADIKKAVEDHNDIRVTLKNYRKDGTEFWNDLLISPINNDEGVTTHFIGMQLDITDRMQYTEKLENIQHKLRKSNEELEQFTYAASHDLQEPLRMVSSYLQLLHNRYNKAFDDDAKIFMEFAIEGAERMQTLINDLLTLSRVSSTAKKFKPVSFDGIIDKALFNLKLTIEETKATITRKGDMPELPVDGVQMVQLVQNLVSNALKYRKKDEPPVITISAERAGDSYVFTVQDNGIGIEPQYFERIFTIFQRLHTRDEYTGTGVGLAICSKIIDRHHGKLWVESEYGKGTSFIFSIPIKRKATA